MNIFEEKRKKVADERKAISFLINTASATRRVKLDEEAKGGNDFVFSEIMNQAEQLQKDFLCDQLSQLLKRIAIQNKDFERAEKEYSALEKDYSVAVQRVDDLCGKLATANADLKNIKNIVGEAHFAVEATVEEIDLKREEPTGPELRKRFKTILGVLNKAKH